MKIKLTAKLLTPLFALLFLSLLLTLMIVRQGVTQLAIETEKSRAFEIVDAFTLSLEEELSARNFSRVVSSLSMSPDIDEIIILNPVDSQIIASSNIYYRRAKLTQLPTHIQAMFEGKTDASPTHFESFSDKQTMFVAPLRAIDAKENTLKFYPLFIMFNKDMMFRNIKSIEQRLMLFFSISFVIIFVICYLIVRRVIQQPISELKQAILSQHQGDLNTLAKSSSADELGELANEFNRMMLIERDSVNSLKKSRDEAEMTAKRKSQFLATMSHEIRTPINGILGLTQIAQKSESLPAIKEHLNKLFNSGQILLAIINDILDFSKLSEGKMAMESVNFVFYDSLSRIQELMTPSAKDKGISLQCNLSSDVPMAICSDQQRIEQLLINFIGNAIKFTQRGHVSVDINWQEMPIDSRLLSNIQNENPVQGMLSVSVTDTGIGIDNDKIPQLFDAFSQEDSSTSREFGGTGLGLSICNRLVEGMSGNITVTSEKGTGSCFNFTLPVTGVRGTDYIMHTWEPALLPQVNTPHHLTTLQHELLAIINDVSTNSHKVTVLKAQDIRTVDDIPNNTFVIIINDDDQNLSKLNIVENDLIKCITAPIDITYFVDQLITIGCTEEKEMDEVQQNQLENKTILLVEDNLINRMIAQEMLSMMKVNVLNAENGKEAIEQVLNKDVDLILMDVQMPVMDGYEATMVIRNELNLTLPIVGLSANALAEDKEKAFSIGMNGYLSKPILLDDLENELKRWLIDTPA